jgi:threonine dehydratase
LENDAYQSFKAGRIIGLAGPSESIADAIKVQQLGNLVFPLVQTYVDDIETVSEAEIAQASTYAWSSFQVDRGTGRCGRPCGGPARRGTSGG